MACESGSMPNGGRAIICSSGPKPRCGCGRLAPLQCDWKVPGNASGTCDAPICTNCATSPAPGKDLCRTNAQAWREWKAGNRK